MESRGLPGEEVGLLVLHQGRRPTHHGPTSTYDTDVIGFHSHSTAGKLFTVSQ